MKTRSTIKSMILYYLLAGVVFGIFLVIGFIYASQADMNSSSAFFYVGLPLSCLILGFIMGGAKSYAKWGFPIYAALATFSIFIIIFGNYDWLYMLITFALALLGVSARYLIRRRKGKAK